jgi:two-component system, NtrC family, response regulator
MKNPSRILIIDDDENILRVEAAILKDKGYEVETAATGAEAIEKTEKGHFDLMLVDIRLPDMEGTEVITKVHDTTPKIRKIIVTGYPTLQNAVAAVNNGADAYVMKPFDVEQMLETVRKQLDLQDQERRFSEEKVADFIQTRVAEFDVEEMQTS